MPSPHKPKSRARVAPKATSVPIHPPVSVDEELYAAPADEIEIDGQVFRIGPLTIQQSFSLQAILHRAQINLVSLPPLPDDATPEQREQHAAQQAIREQNRLHAYLSLFPPEQMEEMVALALSQPERPITVRWVREHCTALEAQEVISLWVQHNDLAAYLGEGARAMLGMQGFLQKMTDRAMRGTNGRLRAMPSA